MALTCAASRAEREGSRILPRYRLVAALACLVNRNRATRRYRLTSLASRTVSVGHSPGGQ